ncbi:MAG: FAD-dependent oxidoreductase [Eubacteriales bacterium]
MSELNVKTSAMRRIDHETDLCIVGGGLTGLCAAIAAAREGIKVVLIQDRPVLGGNASSEIRMWVRGAHGLCNRETGIISELEEENIYVNPTLIPTSFDAVLWSKVKAEKNITLLLNCTCCDAEREEKNGVSHITSVTAWQMTTYTWHTVKASYFADCSGDSILAPLSGAKWRVGREAASEYNEAMGKEVADKKTMGMSCLIQARETDHAVPFTAPEWAYIFKTDEDFNYNMKQTKQADVSSGISGVKIENVTYLTRPHKLGTSETNFWWIELGGENDSIHDAEEMRDELLKVAYGIWDHIKNRGDHGADNWELEWVGCLPGKRESRRYIGAYVLTENDVEAGGKFDDIIAFGGWPMDDHNPAGFRSYLTANPPSKLYPAPSPYGIPYRVLYSHEVDNLFFAGRNISATHAAMSSTRVMATCSLLGQAMGTAASICVNDGLTPDGVYTQKIRVLQDKLRDAGCYLPGTVREIPELTKKAKINLSESDRAILLNGIERPDEADTVNYIELDVGASLTFEFDGEEEISELRLYFDPDFSRMSISPNRKMRVFAQKLNTGKDFVPVKVANTLVKSFRVLADGEEIFAETNNRNSLRRIPLKVKAKKLEIVFDETGGIDKVHLFSADIK